MKINHVSKDWIEFLYLSDIPKKTQKEILNDYDHLGEDEVFDRWCYLDFGNRKEYYHISDFLCWDTPWTGSKPEYLKEWHGYKSESFFSSVLIQVSDCGGGFKTGLLLT